jgi:hypothetical protein
MHLDLKKKKVIKHNKLGKYLQSLLCQKFNLQYIKGLRNNRKNEQKEE